METEPPRKRYHFSNIFSIRFADNEVQLDFGVRELSESPEQAMSDVVHVVMTPRSAKILALALNKTVDRFETDNGQIQLPPGKLEEITKGISVSQKRQGHNN